MKSESTSPADLSNALSEVRPKPVRLVSTRRRRDSKHDALLDAARAEFAANGFAGAHIAVIASRVGIRKSTFFHYFPDKEALYVASVASVLDELADAVELVGTGAGPFGAFLDDVVECLHRHVTLDADLPRLALRSLVDDPPPQTPRPHAADRIMAVLVALLTRGVRESALPPGDARASAIGVFMLVTAQAAASSLAVGLPEEGGLIGLTPEMRVANTKACVRRMLGVR